MSRAKPRIRVKDVGKYVSVEWDDTGVQDSILLSVDLKDKSAQVFNLESREIDDPELNQIIGVGDLVPRWK